MNNIITLPELVSKLASTTSTTNRMSELFLREMFATITQALAIGENVTIKDFGQFKLTTSPDGRPEVVFLPSKQMAETLNQPFDAFIPVELDDDISEEMLNSIDHNENDNHNSDDKPASLLMPPPFLGKNSISQCDESQEKQEVGESGMAKEPPMEIEEPEPTPPQQQYTENEASSPKIELQQELLTENDSTVIADNPEPTFDNDDHNTTKRSFLQGLAAGAIGMLIISAIGWWLMSKSGSSQAPDTDTDTVTAMTDSTETMRQESKPVVTDTTSTTMYLSKISQKHYGRYEFWVYIYEENKSIIDDPNNIPPGTVIVIPPAEKYGIDANDKESVKRANQRSFELFGKGSK